MNTPAHIAHQTQGRVRIAIPSRRGDDEFFASLCERLARVALVRHARGNPAAASVVLEYAGKFEDLIPDLQRSALQLGVPALKDKAAPDTGAARDRPQIINGWGNSPMLMAGAAFGIVGVVQAFRGEIMLPALTAFWYAANALRIASISAPGGAGDSKHALS